MKKRRVLEASKPAHNAGARKSGAAVHGSRPGDVVVDLEAQFFATIEEQERDYLLTVKNPPKRKARKGEKRGSP